MSAALMSAGTYGQVTPNLKDQIKKDNGYSEDVVDDIYGITIYEKLNPMLDGDSTRMCDGYACNGWVIDKYESGGNLHKGYYIDGQLKVYKNFYPDGSVERDFKSQNTFMATMKMFYKGGTLKSEVKYVEAAPLIWSDYFDNGQLEYYEEFHKSFDYHIAKRSYFKDGKPESLFEMINKKKLEYTQNDFYSLGAKKLEGALIYDKKIYDYRKIGTWKFYAESGSLEKVTP
jgi:hypothetical protein